ncbi:MAG: hypothetical protein Q4C58_08790 [Eubacteriales bacterium]|nr:hypothetical protein [Eubacteriales bacterium]
MKRKIVLIIVLASLLLGGCGISVRVVETESVSEGAQERESGPEDDIEETQEARQSEEEQLDEGETEERELSAEELQEFTDFVNEIENNGFLLSQYMRPEEVDLGEALYNGAGMENAPFTEGERQAYLDAGYTVETDITNLTTKQIDDFLQKKMGISLEDAEYGLDWFYYEEGDCYLFQHGDTNFTFFTCTEGKQVSEDLYVIHCKSDNDYRYDCMVTLQKAGDSYQFLFNIYEDAQDVYVEETEEDVKRQLEIFAQAKDEWTMQDYGNLLVGYAVYDLDRDGRLELITQATMGTGHYSENHFYQVNAAGDGIIEVPQTYYAEYAEFEIGSWNSQQALIDEADGVVYYLASDYTRNGMAESYQTDGAFYMKDNHVYNMVYRSRYVLMNEDGVEQESFYDAEGNEIDEKSWEQLYKDFCEGKTPYLYEINWITFYAEEAAAMSAQEILTNLEASYEAQESSR